MSHAGRLLVATPLIADPSFERTVVLLLAHGPMGAFGLVINRPTERRVDDVAPEWSSPAAPPGVVFLGGPVDRDTLLGLGRSPDLTPGAPGVIVGDCAAIDIEAGPFETEARWSEVRLFAGSAGWARGQLEDELAEGAWWPVDAAATDPFSPRPGDLWSDILRRQRGEVAWFANHPEDPSAN